MQEDVWYFSHDRQEIVAFLPQDYQNVLEVGCGKGGFSHYLRPGCETWGIEPDRDAAKIASEKMTHVLTGRFEDVASQLPDAYFDLVICNDVIEHMVDHEGFLDDIKTKMKSKTCLVGSIPNVRHYRNLFELLLRKDWRYREEGILDSTHLRFFTEKSLRRTMLKHDFKIEKLAGINSMGKHAFFRNLVKMTFFFFVSVITLGFYHDIRFFQFGFRVRKDS